MSLFFAYYNCHEGALVMHKDNGAIFHVRGNVSLWNMSAVLERWDVENDKLMYTLQELQDSEELRKQAIVVVKSKEFAEQFLILDEGKDRLDESLKIALSQITAKKIPPK